MLQFAIIFRILGVMAAFFGLAMAVPWAYGALTGDPSATGLGIASLCGLGLALILLATTPNKTPEISHREGFVIVTLTWLLAATLGALPYLFCGLTRSPTDAFFEAMSGFTTTGSTIFSGLDAMPHAILLWRAITQWLGGMGMIVLSIAILPLLGVGGMQLFKAETPGPVADKLSPRVRDTAARLWGIYTFLTLAETAILIALHLSPFDAVCHSLATLATGGFSTHDASVGFYQSAAVDWVVTLFMLAGGINFVLHYRILAGRWRTLQGDSELKFFALLFSGACLLTVVALRVAGHTWGSAARFGIFQVASVITTSGFATADYALWPFVTQGVLLTVMFTGAMAGSTCGGIKSVRILLLFKQGFQQLRHLVHPHAVTQVRLSGRTVDPEIVHEIWGFFFLYLLVLVIASLALTSLGIDLITATTAVITAMGNVGPGLGMVGPSHTFAALPGAAKWILSLCMLLGRLELYTVLVLFLPEFWRR
ncbi:MAG: potassium transporter [Nitrospirae bacterium CG18_big_fil_WC_8_21_14_2_50_70_55]|nr:TrkH family potassium uptake protein [Deltaproteobacteria bacterium]OIP65035.1 MAG: potassium transporter [Nitrospirae bacterium CG2_30_70_394]PIQ04322.1 MAG: potassium transporter [Nitrospirae bacterium CG18_big_fil_WC_8_21_14_2_50_70_55]PIW82424.1 MAG: potassium transporter [Nitrospirae bacterium CG_4_8_14_3_um_filter_70_85]PIX82930.1 MAG: potassium transporter [Nitrospirae bacterium CG_4_10_14_3_um_filter_70_108]PJB95483.1 MAG: potassium transporter [Nitrospirae bacterium CG_4_9_14_0_8_u